MQRLLPCFLALLVLGSPAVAAEPDPVEQFRRTLAFPVRDSSNRDELTFRKKMLEKRAKDLSHVDDLRQVLWFQEWRDEDRDQAIGAVDAGVRGTIEKRFIEDLRKILTDGKAIQKQAAAVLIAETGTGLRATGTKNSLMRELAPELIHRCGDEEAAVRGAAARALGAIHSEPKAAAAALGGLLGHKDLDSRRAGAAGLAEMVRIIREMTRGKFSRGIDVTRDDVIPVCLPVVAAASRGLANADPQTQRSCLEAIQLAAALLTEHIPDPVPASSFPPPGRKPSEEEGRDMESFRTQLEAERESELPLARALNDQTAAVIRALAADDLAVCEMAALALESMAEARIRLRQRAAGLPDALKKGPNDKVEEDPLRTGLLAAVPALAKGLTHKDVRGRLAMIYALETIDADALAASDAAIQALSDESPFVRWGAARVLGKIAPQSAEKAVPALAKVLNDENGDARVTAAAVLERYGPAAKGAVAALAKAVTHKDPSMRVPAIRALSAMGPDAKEAAPALVKGLADPEPEVRQAAARALGKLGKLDADSTAALTQALKDSDPEVRRAASAALLGPS